MTKNSTNYYNTNDYNRGGRTKDPKNYELDNARAILDEEGFPAMVDFLYEIVNSTVLVMHHAVNIAFDAEMVVDKLREKQSLYTKWNKKAYNGR